MENYKKCNECLTIFPFEKEVCVNCKSTHFKEITREEVLNGPQENPKINSS